MVDFTLLEPIFREIGIEPGWLYSLTYGNNEFYNNNTEILSYYYFTDTENKEILVINSGGIDETKFSYSIMKRILNLIKDNKYVLITTTNREVEEYVFVIEGVLRIKIGKESMVLKKGDALKFRANVDHEYSNLESVKCRFQNINVYHKNLLTV